MTKLLIINEQNDVLPLISLCCPKPLHGSAHVTSYPCPCGRLCCQSLDQSAWALPAIWLSLAWDCELPYDGIPYHQLPMMEHC